MSRWCASHLPSDHGSVSLLYIDRVSEFARGGDLITDAGAGRSTPFAGRLHRGCRVLGVDLLSEDLAANRALTDRVTRDIVTDGLPPEAQGSQVVCSRFVLEHMPKLDAFTGEAFRVTRPGGYTVHLFAGRWSAFAIVNRLLPDILSRRILFALRPESRDVGGFPTYYDHTDPRAARERFQRAGFVDVQTELSWEVSQYFDWFVPLYCLARAWECLARRLRLEAVASYVVLTARRPDRPLSESPDRIQATVALTN
jgi:SAM-dependent methyltransferase